MTPTSLKQWIKYLIDAWLSAIGNTIAIVKYDCGERWKVNGPESSEFQNAVDAECEDALRLEWEKKVGLILGFLGTQKY